MKKSLLPLHAGRNQSIENCLKFKNLVNFDLRR